MYLVSITFSDKKGEVACYNFPSDFLCPTVPKHFVERTFCVSENFRNLNFLWIGEQVALISVDCFCLTVPQTSDGEPSGIQLNSGIEKLLAKNGYAVNSRRKFLSRSTKKFRRGTLLCFNNFRRRKSSFIKRVYCLILSKNSSVKEPKKLVGEHFAVLENFRIGIFNHRRVSGITVVRLKFFVSHYRKFSQRNSSVCQKLSTIDEVYG